jgi:hypothetical protein
MLRPPPSAHPAPGFGCGQRRGGAEGRNAARSGLPDPFRFLGSSAAVTARFLGALGAGSALREVPTGNIVFTLTAGRMVTADLFAAGGWLEIAVGWRPRTRQGRCRYDGRGHGSVWREPTPGPRRVVTQTRAGQRVQVADCAFLRVPRSAIYGRRWPMVPGVEIALSMLVHFAAATRKVARRLSRVALRPGTGRSKMCIKQLYVLTVRGPYIN